MKERRDTELGALLRRADEAPPLGPDFDARLWRRIEREAETGARRRRLSRRPRLPRRSLLLWRRRPVVAGATTLLIAVVVAAVVLFGLPLTSRVAGPEPVSAAEVINKMLLAMSAGETLQADSIDRLFKGQGPDGSIEYFPANHLRLFLRSDGSVRFSQTDAPQTSRPPQERERPDASDVAYDAVHGVLREYFRGWDDDAGPNGRYLDRLTVTTGYPLGPPDAAPPLQGIDFSGTARAAQAVDAATLETSSFRGRPVWVISVSTRAAVDPSLPYDEVSLTTIDQETCLPMRFQLFMDGNLSFEYSWTNVRIDEPLPDTAFTFAPPEGADVVRADRGFRRLPLDRIAEVTERPVVLPRWLPAGYVRKWTATARKSTTDNGVTTGTDVVAVQYVRGFDLLTVTTRSVADPASAAWDDPFSEDLAWAGRLREDVPLKAGSFGGVSAAIVMGPRINVAHLWAVKDGIMLTVAGSVSAEELVRIAESIE